MINKLEDEAKWLSHDCKVIHETDAESRVVLAEEKLLEPLVQFRPSFGDGFLAGVPLADGANRSGNFQLFSFH